MSFTAELESASSQLAHIDRAISEIVGGLSVLDVLKDPALIQAKAELVDSLAEASPQNLTIYQLNAKLKELEDASSQLNEFWVIKNLIREVEVALEALSDDESSIDKDELLSIVKKMEKLHGRVWKASQLNLTISSPMIDKYESIAHEFSAVLNHVLLRFIPVPISGEYTVNEMLKTTENSLNFDQFVDVANTFESLHSSCRVSEMLSSLKIEWDISILEPLISKQASLKLSIREERTHILKIIESSNSPTEFSMDAFLYSLQCFVHFVNATHLRSLKNYFSTKISNGLADTISESIRFFYDDEKLTLKLLQTLELFSSSGWTMPLRNIFMAQSTVRDTLKGLHLNWITDKYIDELRNVFTSPQFEQIVENQHIVSRTIEVPPPKIHRLSPRNEDTLPKEEIVDPEKESEELEWDDNWGSDDDEDLEKAITASVNSDAWDDNWDDNWSDDEGSNAHTTETAKHKPTQSKSEQVPIVQTADRALKPPSTQASTETYSFVVTSVPERISVLLANFDAETDGADAQILMETILSLALTSYVPLSQLFLMLNDLRHVECKSLYLNESVDTEWRHFCQSFSNDVTQILLSPGLLESDAPEIDDFDGSSGFESMDQIRTRIGGLFESQLRGTNAYELKVFVLQVLNLVNNIVLRKILRCDEITEYRSAEFTRYLEKLQDVERKALAHFGEDVSVLATTNKVMQTKFLINNHLKSIMEYFYQGELYDFSTDELVSVIKSVFIPSELRENCLDEIIDVRNS